MNKVTLLALLLACFNPNMVQATGLLGFGEPKHEEPLDKGTELATVTTVTEKYKTGVTTDTVKVAGRYPYYDLGAAGDLEVQQNAKIATTVIHFPSREEIIKKGKSTPGAAVTAVIYHAFLALAKRLAHAKTTPDDLDQTIGVVVAGYPEVAKNQADLARLVAVVRHAGTPHATTK